MNTEKLVNGYVLPNLFYELLFLDEYNIDEEPNWSGQCFVDEIIRRFVVQRFNGFSTQTKVVVRNTLRYLLATEPADSEKWDAIWQASSAPIPTPNGVRAFVKNCYEILFEDEPLPMEEELASYSVNHDMSLANRLN
jgi:hypothetical protein